MRGVKWKCDCGETFRTEPDRWKMEYCPKCKDEWVDHEEHYCRRSMGVKPAQE